eukprot:scaffold111237_cov28-Tisochrysis_lutea.AAC.3
MCSQTVTCSTYLGRGAPRARCRAHAFILCITRTQVCITAILIIYPRLSWPLVESRRTPDER